jgi:hypothetical protein
MAKQNANARLPAESPEAHYEKFANLQQKQQQATGEKKNPGQKGRLDHQQQFIQQQMAIQHATAQAAAGSNISGQQGQMNPQQMHNLQQAAQQQMQQQQQHQWQADSIQLYEGSRGSGARSPPSDYAAPQPTEIDLGPDVRTGPSLSMSEYNNLDVLRDSDQQPTHYSFPPIHSKDASLELESAAFPQGQDEVDLSDNVTNENFDGKSLDPKPMSHLGKNKDISIPAGPVHGERRLTDMQGVEVQVQQVSIQQVIHQTVSSQTGDLSGWQAQVPIQERMDLIFSM